MKKILLTLFIICTGVFAHAQDFALGADISWLTGFEKQGHKVYNFKGEERETTALMKELGLNAIRLRVWVNPKGGDCGKEDVLMKALRAEKLGMDVMIDFHYSDSWADPGKQFIPEAWKDHKYKQMCKDVAAHTTEVLQLLKDNGVTPKWVQVGNETSNGFLWPVGSLKENPKQYAGLFKAGYDACKAVFPSTKVIVHLDNGFDEDLYERNLDALREGGATWDLIGMSIYPYWAKEANKEPSAARLFNDMQKNIKKVVKRYGTDVIIAETGFEVDEKNAWKMEMGREQLEQLIDICMNKTDGHCKGVFYWEPTANPRFYKLGAFTADGRPTEIMRAFSPKSQDRTKIAFETTEGTIVCELYNETPKHRDNYLKLIQNKAFDNVLFHRVIANFMIQAGDMGSKEAPRTSVENPAEPLGENNALDEKGEKYSIEAEILPQFFHHRGALAAARQSDEDNPQRMSSSSQFYIVWGDWPARKPKEGGMLPYYEEEYNYGTPWLDGKYTVFGRVTSGMDIVDKIQRLSTDKYNRPLKDVRITRAYVVE